MCTIIPDLSGSAILNDTPCDDRNSKLIWKKDAFRNLADKGEKAQQLYLRTNDNDGIQGTALEFDNDEREYERDFDRYAMLNEVVSEECDHLNKIPIKSCASWHVDKEHADSNHILSIVTRALNVLEVTTTKTIVAIVSQKEQYQMAAVWEVSVNQGQTYVNKLSSAILDI